jgi:pectin methylesterase-like acyl-CoA thioesterase
VGKRFLKEDLVRRTLIVAVASLVLLATGSATALAWPGPYLTVATDGSGDFTSIQAAVDAVPAPKRVHLHDQDQARRLRRSGHHPGDQAFLVFRGQGEDPTQVVITDDRANGTPKPGGWHLGHDWQRVGHHRRP